MLKYLRTIFFTGLFVILPIIITIVLLFWAFSWSDAILGNSFNQFLRSIRWIEPGINIPGIGIAALLVLIFLTGALAHNYLGRKLIKLGEFLLNKIPIFRSIYGPTKQITGILSNTDQNAFRKVVLVEYPRKGLYSPGFFIGETFDEANQKTGQALLNIFVPAVPNPTTGFMIFVPEKDVIFLDISVEDGFKMIISVGVIKPGTNSVNSES